MAESSVVFIQGPRTVGKSMLLRALALCKQVGVHQNVAMKRIKRLRWSGVLLCVLILVVSACEGGDGTDVEADDGAAGDSLQDDDGGDDTDSDDDDGRDDGGAAAVDHDFGVDYENRVIRVGVNTDQTGLFSAIATLTTDAQEVYWEWLNDRGGIQGWKVETVILDNGYDVAKHIENYDVMAGEGDRGVVMFSQSWGSPQTAAIAERLVEDQIAAIPVSWYSGWADPDIGQNVFEMMVSYCVEGMNGTEYMSEQHGGKLALATAPGEYGEDGAAGVKIAAETLGLEIVYDGQGALVPGTDISPVVSGIIGSGADWVWLATDPSTTANLIGEAVSQGFTGQWSGNAPSWSAGLLELPSAGLFDEYFTYSAYTALSGSSDLRGMSDIVDAMGQYRPDEPLEDYYILGWLQGLITTQILDKAISSGDLTRAGVLAAAQTVTVDLHGLAPEQTWNGEPDDYIVRETYLYDVDMSTYQPEATMLDGRASAGYNLLEGPYVSQVAQDWSYEPCFQAS